MWRDASWIFLLFHRKWVPPCWVTAILFKSWSSYFVILSAFLEYHSFHFNAVAFISKMNSSLLGCCVLGHLLNIIIKCECNGFLFFSAPGLQNDYFSIGYCIGLLQCQVPVFSIWPGTTYFSNKMLYTICDFNILSFSNEWKTQSRQDVSIYQIHSSHYQNMEISPWRNHYDLYRAENSVIKSKWMYI